MAQVIAMLGTLTASELTPEEKDELARFHMDKLPADAGYLMFFEQRRKTRTWVLGSATAAMGLGLLTGWLAWGRK